MIEAMVSFCGHLDGGVCEVYLVFREGKLARVEYSRNLTNRINRVRNIDLLPDYIQNSNWRDSCLCIWYLEDWELDEIHFEAYGIDRAVVDRSLLVNGRLRSSIEKCA